MLDEVKKAFERIKQSIPNKLNAPINNINREFQSLPKKIETPLKKFMKTAVEDPIKEVTNGIDSMIKDFQRIICFMNKSHTRFSNMSAAFDNLFTGIIEEFIALGHAIGLGFSSVSALVYHFGIFLDSYLQCGVKFLSNIFFCFPFYILTIIGQILYLPIRLVLWFLVFFLGINLYPTEKSIWESIKDTNDAIAPFIGFHLIHYPKFIRDNCYTCIRLKKVVLTRQKKKTDKTFTETIPDILSNKDNKRNKIPQALKHFDEVDAMPNARTPKDVK